MAKNRPLRAVYRRLGRIDAIIAAVIARNGKAQVLEMGCGLGLPMIELQRKFGKNLEITGINKDAKFNQPRQAMWEGIKKRALMPWVPFIHERQHGFPAYVNCDGSDPLPFADDSFDLVYSIATTFFFHDKMGFLQEVNRILRPGGIARLHFSWSLSEFANYAKKPPEPYDNICEIRDAGGEVIPFPEFIKSYESLKIVHQPDGRDDYLELRKQAAPLDFGLELVEGYFLNTVNPDWDAFVKSVYRVKPA
jgi:SAM-dependent methyltransferase